MIGRTIVLALLLMASAAAAQPATDAGRGLVQVRSSVSRTAVWVGDTVDFVVEFSLAPQVEVIADDLAPARLKLEGLEAVSTSSERHVADDGGVTHRVRYVLSSYEVGAPTLRIGAWPVRYYVRRAGERAEDVRPAGEVQVPAAVIARRSTLPDELTSLDIRAAGAPADVPRPLRVMRGVGLALILLAAAPLAIWASVLIGRRRSQTRRPRVSAARARARSALEELRAADADTEAGRREAYDRLEQALRQHFAATREIPAHALVSSELADRLHAAGSPHASAAGELLAECERARYGPPERLPPKERFAAALERAEQMLAGTRS